MYDFTFPPELHESSSCFKFLPPLGGISIFNLSYCCGCLASHFSRIFDLHNQNLMMNHFKPFFMCLLTVQIYIYILMMCLAKSFGHLKKLICSFYLSCKYALYILDANLFSAICIVNIFSLHLACLFFFFPAMQHGMWDLSHPTRDQTCTPCSWRAASWHLEHQTRAKKSHVP